MAPDSDKPTDNAQDIQQALGLAQQHLGAGELSKAESICHKILKTDPNQPVALHLHGVIAHQVGKIDVAVDLISQALTIKPNYAEAHSNLGNALKDLGRLEDAVASYRRALAINPNLVECHFNLGLALSDLNKLEEVVSSFLNAVRLMPGSAEAHFNLGNSLKNQGKLEDAIASYKKVLAIEPGFVDAHANLGLALMTLGKLVEAVACCQKGLAIQPDHPLLNFNLGVARKGQDRLDEAIECLRRADPGTINQETSYTLLECFYRKRDVEGFERQLERISKNQRFNFKAAYISAFASHQLGTVNSYKFCDNPFDLVTAYDLLDDGDVSSVMLKKLEIMVRNNIGNEMVAPAHIPREHRRHASIPFHVASGGFTSIGNLFAKKTLVAETLEPVIRRCVEKFAQQYENNRSRLFRDWPAKYRLEGWYFRMLEGGEVTAHVHQGWLSGVFYVRVPANKENNAGNIEFTLRGYGLPVIRDDFPTRVFTSKVGRLFLFPSSLPHRVLPFSENQDRISISFDLIPQ